MQTNSNARNFTQFLYLKNLKSMMAFHTQYIFCLTQWGYVETKSIHSAESFLSWLDYSGMNVSNSSVLLLTPALCQQSAFQH